MGKRFGGVEITPVRPRSGDDAIRILLTAIKGSRARLILRDRISFMKAGARDFSSQMNDLANGRGMAAPGENACGKVGRYSADHRTGH
jgi:tRNA1(Val) A37 N6-methylase TrmN6